MYKRYIKILNQLKHRIWAPIHMVTNDMPTNMHRELLMSRLQLLHMLTCLLKCLFLSCFFVIKININKIKIKNHYYGSGKLIIFSCNLSFSFRLWSNNFHVTFFQKSLDFFTLFQNDYLCALWLCEMTRGQKCLILVSNKILGLKQNPKCATSVDKKQN